MNFEAPIIILLIAIPTFFVLYWILKRKNKNKKIKIWKTILGALIIAPILYLLLAIGIFSVMFYEPQYSFDKEKWFSEKHKRFEMRDDIIDSKILEGKRKFEIIDLIGKPDSGDSSDNWTYNLGGSSSGFGWQFNSLELTFNSDKVEKVKKIEIVD